MIQFIADGALGTTYKYKKIVEEGKSKFFASILRNKINKEMIITHDNIHKINLICKSMISAMPKNKLDFCHKLSVKIRRNPKIKK